MDSCQLIDSIELSLNSLGNFYTALGHALQNGLDEYLKKYLVINPADWQAQFYTRQIASNPPDNAPGWCIACVSEWPRKPNHHIHHFLQSPVPRSIWFEQKAPCK